MRRLFGLAFLLAFVCSVVVGQTVSYTLPEPGEYRCAAFNLSATPNSGGGVTFGVEQIASASGNLVLLAGNKYRFTNGGGGSYTAKPNGEIRFTGPLGNPKLRTYFIAKGGAFNIYIESGPTNSPSRLECTRRSSAARLTLKGDPNPGLPGTILYYSQTDTAHRLLQVSSGRPQPLPTGAYMRQSRNGELIFENANGELVITAPDGQVRERLTEEIHQETLVRVRDDFTLSPDGQRYAYNIRLPNGPAVLVRDRSGRLLANIPGYQSPDFLPDGRLLLAGLPNGPQGVFITDTTYANPRRINANTRTPFTPTASPDGRAVAFVDAGKLYAMNLDGSGLRPLPLTFAGTERQALGCPVWSPDGKWVAVIADADGAPFNAELMVSPVRGDASKVQVLTDTELNPFRTTVQPLYCLSWR